MKFRDPKTGEVFEDIQNARIAFCVGRTCSEDCPFGCAETIERDPVKAALLMRLELVEEKEEPMEEKEEPMEKKDKPRICEVLGVEVGEKFTYPGMIGEFWVTENGHLRSAVDDDDKLMICVPALINHPNRIIRKPRFTAEEVADARVLARALLADGFERDNEGDVFATSSVACRTLLDSRMFPSLRPGRAVSLKDIAKQ